MREPAEGDTLTIDDLEEIGWAEIYRTEKDAQAAVG
jgi:hypothetical protein